MTEQREVAEVKDGEAIRSGGSSTTKRLALTSILLIAVVISWYVAADRSTPYSNQAIATGMVIPVVPEVSGTVTEIQVDRNQIVQSGDVLVKIDPERYRLAYEKARIELARAGQDIGVDTAAVETAQAMLLDAAAQKSNAETDLGRTTQLFEKKVVAQAELDTARTVFKQAEAAYQKAVAELEKAKTQLGDMGTENIKTRAALNALELAKLDLQDTVIKAPSDGGVTNLQIGIGHYARAGTPLMTFISSQAVWLEAMFRENNLGRLKAGNKAEIILDIAPGKVFPAEVISVGFGVSNNLHTDLGRLPKIKESGGWLRDPQRFPVLLRFTDDSAYGLRRVGGQASVIIYTGDNILLNLIGKLRIRLSSFLSYLY